MTQASAGRPTARQRALLDDLVGVALADGFADLTLDDLAARLRCSKSTLYALAPSKEQLAVLVVRAFFRQATDSIEQQVAAADGAARRVQAYLSAVADAMAPASRAFVEDLAAAPATREVYEANASAAAERIRRLIAEGLASGEFRAVHAPFVAEMIGQTIIAIQRGDIGRATGLSDAGAFAELASFVVPALVAASR